MFEALDAFSTCLAGEARCAISGIVRDHYDPTRFDRVIHSDERPDAMRNKELLIMCGDEKKQPRRGPTRHRFGSMTTPSQRSQERYKIDEIGKPECQGEKSEYDN
jgi:hypothetical protein